MGIIVTCKFIHILISIKPADTKIVGDIDLSQLKHCVSVNILSVKNGYNRKYPAL